MLKCRTITIFSKRYIINLITATAATAATTTIKTTTRTTIRTTIRTRATTTIRTTTTSRAITTIIFRIQNNHIVQTTASTPRTT